MKQTVKKYTLMALLVVVMLFISVCVLIMATTSGTSSDYIVMIMILAFCLANAAITIICTGIIASKIERLNSKSELNKEDD